MTAFKSGLSSLSLSDESPDFINLDCFATEADHVLVSITVDLSYHGKEFVARTILYYGKDFAPASVDERRFPTWYDGYYMRYILCDPITLATVVIAIATVINVFISAFLWQATKRTATITKNMFEAAHRPYLAPVLSAIWDTDRRRLNFNTQVNNFGTVPARKISATIRATLNDKEVRLWDEPTPASLLLLPQQPLEFSGCVDGEDFAELWEGGAQLRLSIDLRYKGAGNEEYPYHESYVIDRNLVQFHFSPVET